MSEIRIWKCARTEAQINENLMQKIDNPQKLDDLVGSWNFDKINDSDYFHPALSIEQKQSDNKTLELWTTNTNVSALKLTDYLEPFDHWSRVKNQGKLGACTAHAGVSVLEYFERKMAGPGVEYNDYSWLFLYRNTLELNQFKHKSEKAKIADGISIREMMAALVAFGVPQASIFPEKEHLEKLDAKQSKHDYLYLKNIIPSSFCYGIAQKTKPSSYFNFIKPKIITDSLEIINDFSVSQIVKTQHCPSDHSETCPSYQKYSEEDQAQKKLREFIARYQGKLANSEQPLIRLEDDKVITAGAFKIRNSWGEGWGKDGYGWLPYAYLLADLTFDWWSILKAEWFDSDYFGLSGGSKDTEEPWKCPHLSEDKKPIDLFH